MRSLGGDWMCAPILVPSAPFKAEILGVDRRTFRVGE